MNLKLLSCITAPELLSAIIDTIRRHADVWACMDAHEQILDALCTTHATWNWGTRRAQSRPLLCLLIEFHTNPRIPEDAKERITEDAAALIDASAFAPSIPASIFIAYIMQGLRAPMSPTQREPSILPRIARLAQEDDTSLATNIWLRHGLSPHWVQEVWQNTLESLRELPLAFPEAEERHVRVSRYAQFLWNIDQHLRPGALDELVFYWATGPGRTEFRHLGQDVWSALSMVILYLITRDALTAPNIMKGIVYPIWELCALVSGPSVSTMLNAANHIASRLLLHDQGGSVGATNGQLGEIQKLQTRRRSVYIEENFSLLLSSLPNLVVLQHKNDLDEELRLSTAQLCIAISRHPEFRMVAYRNLELVSRAFWNVDFESMSQDLEKHLSNALQQILSDREPC